MKQLTTKAWFARMIAEIENDFDFIFEGYIYDITEDICQAMEKKSVSVAELAKLLEISEKSVEWMLEGNSSFTIKRLVKVATVLDLKLVIKIGG